MTAPASSHASAGSDAVAGRSLLRAGAGAWVAALLLNVALLALARSVIGIEVVHPDPPGSATLAAVELTHVAVSTSVGALLAVVGAALAARFLPRPRVTFIAVGSVVTLLSLGGPLSVTGASAGSTTVLLAMHAIVAGAVLPSLARALPARRAVA